jgi:acyl-lipid omega-6 desaturase (Delta-12 desaturase)
MQPDGLSNSRHIDRLTRQEELSLADLRAAIPKDCLSPTEWRSWLTLIRVLGSVLLSLWLLSNVQLEWGASLFWQIPAVLSLWLLYGAVLLGFFLIGHECGHGSFSRHAWVNRIVGTLCMAPIFNGFRTWALTHGHHHVFTQIRGEDVDWSSHLVTEEEYALLTWREDFAIKLGYSMPFGILFWILWNAIQRGSQVEPMLQPAVYARNRSALKRANIVMICTTLLVYGGFWYGAGFWGMLKYHHIPVSVASLLGGIMVSVGHANVNTLWYDRSHWTPLRGQLVSTYDYRFPRLLEYLVLNINIHIPHHVSVRIPWYRLKAAGKALKLAHPEYYQELPFRFKDMRWIVWAPYLESDPDLGIYQMKLERTYSEPERKGTDAHVNRSPLVDVSFSSDSKTRDLNR